MKMIEFQISLIVLGQGFTVLSIISLGLYIIKGRQKNYLLHLDSSEGVKLGTARKKAKPNNVHEISHANCRTEVMVPFVLQQYKEYKLFFKVERGGKRKIMNSISRRDLPFPLPGDHYLFTSRLVEDGRRYYHFTDECNRPLWGCFPGLPPRGLPAQSPWVATGLALVTLPSWAELTAAW